MGESNFTYTATSRIPTRPLSYENRSLALKRELIIDYKNAYIYICDLNGTIVNITQKMLDATEAMINSDDTKQTIRDVSIKLEDGSSVTIESGIVELFKNLKNISNNTIPDIYNEINTVKNKITEVEGMIPEASISLPKADGTNASYGSSVEYARADHIHPKGLATVADSADSVEWENIRNRPTSFTPSTHNHDDTYLKLTGGSLTGDLNIKDNKIYLSNNCGIRGLKNGTTMSGNSNTNKTNSYPLIYMTSNDMVSVGYSDQCPVLLDSRVILSGKNYGSNLPTDNLYEGRIYLMLV